MRVYELVGDPVASGSVRSKVCMYVNIGWFARVPMGMQWHELLQN